MWLPPDKTIITFKQQSSISKEIYRGSGAIESAHHNFEAGSLTSQKIPFWNLNVFECDGSSIDSLLTHDAFLIDIIVTPILPITMYYSCIKRYLSTESNSGSVMIDDESGQSFLGWNFRIEVCSC